MGTKEELLDLREMHKGQLSIIRCAISDLTNPERVDREVTKMLVSIAKQQDRIALMLERKINGQDIIDNAQSRVDELNQRIKLLENHHKVEQFRALEAQLRELKSDPEIERLASIGAQVQNDS
ncbi:hypothetical protein LCGC14_0357320 [marine sediment metagenome]|uniref:Uncharacterized protein n=1 Tax=marine sediment metagenome TaxID=412755 RepID=A0A0F9WH73_9ZZZZ